MHAPNDIGLREMKGKTRSRNVTSIVSILFRCEHRTEYTLVSESKLRHSPVGMRKHRQFRLLHPHLFRFLVEGWPIFDRCCRRLDRILQSCRVRQHRSSLFRSSNFGIVGLSCALGVFEKSKCLTSQFKVSERSFHWIGNLVEYRRIVVQYHVLSTSLEARLVVTTVEWVDWCIPGTILYYNVENHMRWHHKKERRHIVPRLVNSRKRNLNLKSPTVWLRYTPNNLPQRNSARSDRCLPVPASASATLFLILEKSN